MAAGLEKTSFDKLDLRDPFFGTLKAQYKEFKTWFEKKAKAKEPVYVVRTSSKKLSGFVYLKQEDEPIADVVPALPKMSRLKVGTLKITPHGTKLGERVLKKIFDHAIEAGVAQIYMTVFPEHKALIKLVERYGFVQHGTKTTKNGTELVMLRDLSVFTGDIEKDYPFIHTKGKSYFLLAIYPDYHTQLFPDSILKTEKPDILEDVSHTNTIHKVYVSRLALTRMKPGDVVVIYRTTDIAGLARYRSVVTSVCVVEETKAKKDFSTKGDFIKFALPHSVFSKEELGDMFAESRVYAVKMTYNAAFKRRTIRATLLDDVGVPEQPRWDLKPLTKGQFKRIMELGKADESLVVD